MLHQRIESVLRRLIGYGAMVCLAGLLAPFPSFAHEAREACREVTYSHDPFEFTGRSTAASTIIMCLPTSHSTEAFLDMLGENAVDRVEEVALACAADPDGRVADLGIPGTRRLVRAVRTLLAARACNRLHREPARATAAPAPSPDVEKIEYNKDLLAALETLGIIRLAPALPDSAESAEAGNG